MAVVQVSGPPCAGKSNYILLRHAYADTVLDDKALADRFGSRDAVPAWAWAEWQRQVLARVQAHRGPHVLWVIRGNPEPMADGVRVVTLNPGREECHRRADRDRRPAATHEWIDRWFDKYE